MPLEVRQIGIRLSIGADGEPAQGDANGDDSELRLTRAERGRILEECVRAVLAELRSAQER